MEQKYNRNKKNDFSRKQGGHGDHRPNRRPNGNRGGDWEKYNRAPRALPEQEEFWDESRELSATASADSSEEGTGLIIGRNAVRELLRSGRAIDKILVRRGELEGSIVALVAEAGSRGIPVVETDKSKMDAMSGFAPHQGIIAMAAEKEYCTVEDILAIAEERGEAPFIVIADGITDPYNLGALIRCAEGAGAHGIIIPKRRSTGLTPLVSKSSAGAIEHMAIAKVSNISNTILSLKEKGVWVFAAEAGGTPYYETNFKGPCAIVLGSEGNGVSQIVVENSDGLTSIPMYGKVNSFNVSTAASVILCEVARQNRTK
jgi:23S rRNA (guanosine2251-2'-O)-methyltransferase